MASPRTHPTAPAPSRRASSVPNSAFRGSRQRDRRRRRGRHHGRRRSVEDRNVISETGSASTSTSGTPGGSGRTTSASPQWICSRPNRERRVHGRRHRRADDQPERHLRQHVRQGIRVQDGAAVIRNNWIGLAGDGVSTSGMERKDHRRVAQRGRIRHRRTGATDPNIIAFNGSTGVRVQGGTGTSLRRNRSSTTAPGDRPRSGGVRRTIRPRTSTRTPASTTPELPVVSSASSTMVSALARYGGEPDVRRRRLLESEL